MPSTIPVILRSATAKPERVSKDASCRCSGWAGQLRISHAKMRPMPFRPSRRGLVPPFIAMDVMRAANEREAQGQSVIHLEVGQPGTPAPAAVPDAAPRALIEVGENAHYQPNPELLAEAGDLAGLIVASPANPTGTMIPAADLKRLVEYCRERGIRLVSDEIYHGITYEAAPQTARAFGGEV